MDRPTAVEPNICKILSDGKVVGTGCLIRSHEDQKSTTLKVATSKKLFQNYANGKLVASFRDIYGQPWDVELGADLDKDYMNGEIAVVPVEKPNSQLKETANLEGVPVINQNNPDEEATFSNAFVLKKSSEAQNLQIYKLWFKTRDILMDSVYSENPVVIDSLKRCASYDLAVQGAPVISEKSKFLGIVDFSDKDGRPFFLPLPFLQFMSQSDLPKPTQETQKSTAKKDDRLLPDDYLETLWEDQNFIYDLCKALDPVHSPDSKLKDHRHLAMEFPIPADIRKKIAGSEISPSENLFASLESRCPNLLIKHLLEKLTLAKARQAVRTIQSAIKGGKIYQSDYVSDLPDKNHALKGKLILQLDYNDSWKGLSKEFGISERTCSTFLRDPKFNPARTFFDILRTQSPRLKVSKLKMFLEELGENGMLDELKSIPGTNFLKDLTLRAELMCDVIGPKFNATENNLLYKLAEKFQKQGYISKDVEIRDFQASECRGSPTTKLIDYVLTSLEEQYKIQDLKDGLENIERRDCIHILAKYVKGFDDELEKNMERGDSQHLQISNRPSLAVERACSVIDENENTNSAGPNQGVGLGMSGPGKPSDNMPDRGPTVPNHIDSLSYHTIHFSEDSLQHRRELLNDSGTDFGAQQEQGSEKTKDMNSLDLSVLTISQQPLKERRDKGKDPTVDQSNLRVSADILRNPRPLDSGFIEGPQSQKRGQSLTQGGPLRGQNDSALGGPPGGPPLSTISSDSCASDISEQDQEDLHHKST